MFLTRCILFYVGPKSEFRSDRTRRWAARADPPVATLKKNAYPRTLQRVMSSRARSSQQTRKPRRQMGSRKPSKTGAKVLLTMWAERLRQRGYIDPTRVHTLSQLRPRGCRYAVVPGEAFADDMTGEEQKLAANVCKAVERHVVSLCLFGDSHVECSPDDAVIRQGGVVGKVHRDCVALRRNTRNLQFVAVLQGKVDFMIEGTVNAKQPAVQSPRRRKKAVTIKANQVLVFAGSLYAHSVNASDNCVRVTGWVCKAGHRVVGGGANVVVGKWKC